MTLFGPISADVRQFIMRVLSSQLTSGILASTTVGKVMETAIIGSIRVIMETAYLGPHSLCNSFMTSLWIKNLRLVQSGGVLDFSR